jgi:hypothetical protein
MPLTKPNTNNIRYTYDTVADMRADFAQLRNGMYVRTAEHTAGAGYEGGNVYLIRSSTGAPADDGSIIGDLSNVFIEAVGTFPDGVNVKQFGAVPADRSAAASNTTSINAALAYSQSVLINAGRFYHDNTLVVKTKSTLRGVSTRASFLHHTGTGNAIEAVGTGTDIKDGIDNQTLVSLITLEDFTSDSDGVDQHGIVFNIAKDCRINRVTSLNHQLNQFRIGDPTDDAVTTTDKCDLASVRDCIAFGGTIGYYNGATSGGMYHHCLVNGYSTFGFLLEDSGLTTIRDCNTGSSVVGNSNPIIIQNSATNQSNLRTLVSNRVLDTHTEQVSTGVAMVKINMTGTTKCLDAHIIGCDHYPTSSGLVEIVGNCEDAVIDRNLIQADAGAGGTGIIIGSQALRTYVGKQRFTNGFNVIDNSPTDGTIYESRSSINQVWYQEDVVPGLTDQNMKIAELVNVPSLPIFDDGSVLGIQVRISNPVTGIPTGPTPSLITIDLAKNGVNLGQTIQFDSTTGQTGFIAIPRNARIFTRGDLFNMRYTTSAGMTPVGSIAIVGSAIFEYKGTSS